MRTNGDHTPDAAPPSHVEQDREPCGARLPARKHHYGPAEPLSLGIRDEFWDLHRDAHVCPR
jgi:hypothetical protein